MFLTSETIELQIEKKKVDESFVDFRIFSTNSSVARDLYKRSLPLVEECSTSRRSSSSSPRYPR